MRDRRPELEAKESTRGADRWTEYAQKFEVRVDSPCPIRYDRPLVQLGIPAPDTLVLWCSIPNNRPNPAPDLRSIQLFQKGGDQGNRWVELPCSTDVLWVEGPRGHGRLQLSGLDPDSRYRVTLLYGGETFEVQARTAPPASRASDFHFLSVCDLEPYGHVEDGKAVIPMGTANSLRLLERRATDSDNPPAFLLGLGGMSNVHPITGLDAAAPDPAIAGDVHHRLALAIPPVDAALRAVPSAMMWNASDDPHRESRVGYQALRNPPPSSVEDGGQFTPATVAQLQDPRTGAQCSFQWGADFRLFLLDLQSESVVVDLITWLDDAARTRKQKSTVLAIGSPLPLFGARGPGKRLGSDAPAPLLEAIAAHFKTHREHHQLLLISGGEVGAELVEIADTDRNIIGHEVVTHSLTMPRKSPGKGRTVSDWTPAAGLLCRSSGRHPGPGVVEFRMTHDEKTGIPQVNVVFLPATDLKVKCLANTLEITKHALPLSRSGENFTNVEAFFRPFTEEDFRGEKAGWVAPGWRGEIVLEDVRDAEWEEIKQRRERKRLIGIDGKPEEPLFGVALSGGGVRSGATSFGFLKELDDRGLFRRADYLSTVSGGGYAGGYFQAQMLAKDATLGPLLPEKQLDDLYTKGQYLAPGSGLIGKRRLLMLLVAYVGSIPLNLAPWLAWGFCLGTTLAWAGNLLKLVGWGRRLVVVDALLLAVVLGLHLLLLPLSGRPGRLLRSGLRVLEAFLITAGVLLLLIVFALKMAAAPAVIGKWIKALPGEWGTSVGVVLEWFTSLMIDPSDGGVLFRGVVATFVLALFASYLANPNVLSMHGVLKERIVRTFLGAANEGAPDQELRSLAGRGPQSTAGPYPLFGGCLTVLGEPDPAFIGANGSDYFLLSPLFCGAKLTGYASTQWPQYKHVSVGDALACSAASVNPAMGNHSNTLLTLVGIFLNLRLGVWMWNPRRPARPWFWWRFWPGYALFELLKKAHTGRTLVSVSDGGFIENLGVFELLRRRCKVILAIDNTYDPDYQFQHLRNLIVRADQELGLEIKNDQALAQLCPSAITGLAAKQYTVFTIRSAPGRRDAAYQGILIYAKASLSHRPAYLGRSATRSDADSYRTYNPKFPQDTTLDQFFDQPQWQAYFKLGTEIARSVTEDPEILAAVRGLDEQMPELEKSFARQQRPHAPGGKA